MLTIKNAINAKITKDLYYFASNNGKKDKVYSKITNLIEGKTVLISIFRWSGLQFIPKTIIAILLKLL